MILVQQIRCDPALLRVGPGPNIASISLSSGPEGTAVTISGSAFGNTQGTAKVYFGSVPVATYTSWKNTRLKVKVPAGITGTVQVKVVTTGGESNTKSYTKICSIFCKRAANQTRWHGMTPDGLGNGNQAMPCKCSTTGSTLPYEKNDKEG